jgi:hypothetical protein
VTGNPITPKRGRAPTLEKRMKKTWRERLFNHTPGFWLVAATLLYITIGLVYVLVLPPVRL